MEPTVCFTNDKWSEKAAEFNTAAIWNSKQKPIRIYIID